MSSPALDEQKVVTGKFKLRSPVTAGIGRGDNVSESALGDHHIAGAAGHRSPGQRTGGEEQLVVRRQGIDTGVQLLPQITIGNASAADILAQPFTGNVLDLGRPRRQVHS